MHNKGKTDVETAILEGDDRGNGPGPLIKDGYVGNTGH